MSVIIILLEMYS